MVGLWVIKVMHYRTMTNCPCCHKRGFFILVTHHWYELPNMEEHNKVICTRCNITLRSDVFNLSDTPRSHILPSWDYQCMYIKSLLYLQHVRNTTKSRKRRRRALNNHMDLKQRLSREAKFKPSVIDCNKSGRG